VLLAACQGEKGPAGEPGNDGAGHIPLETRGVVGLVTDAGGDAVAGGTVYFVPATDVRDMGATTTAIDSDTDEPLEDVIRLNGASYVKAEIGADGVYRLPSLPAGSYFVTYMPASTGYLPGGSLCRLARPSSALVNTRLDIEVSAAIPAGAEYVGSSRCIGCHGRAHISGTMHRLGIWSPASQGPLQDVSARYDDLYQAFEDKFDPAGGTTVYFYGYDSSRGFDKYRTSETAPVDPAPPATWAGDTAYAVGAKVSNDGGRMYEAIAAGTSASTGGPTGTAKDITDGTVHWKFINTGTSFAVRVLKDGADYEMEITNLQGAGAAAYPVDAVYGGGVNKQRYLTKIGSGSDFFYVTLPLQFNNAGSEAYPDRTSMVWRDYNSSYYYNEGTRALVVPSDRNKSFEKNCMSCHAVGVRIDPTTYAARTVQDRYYGDFDYDGDGLAEELNVGCETCHGPGSAHWEQGGQGKHIVSLNLLTPEREAMVCGQCHSRPAGKFGTDSPVDAQGRMMVAGTSRNDFLKNHAGGGTPAKLDAAAADLWGDGAVNESGLDHSKAHHQQYTDFIKSRLYKNAEELMTCSSCHDPHKKTSTPDGTAIARQLRKSPNDNAQLCGGCHSADPTALEAHIEGMLSGVPGALHVSSGVKCVDCHMPKTAQTGAARPTVVGFVTATQYFWNDVTSHVFDMPRKSVTLAKKTPTAYVNPCATCHGLSGYHNNL
jgi:hypothetical protein